MNKIMLSYVQPVMVAAVLLFWAFAPAAWTGSAWSIVIATLATTGMIQALEWVNERHSSWRLTWREFFTDAFYVTLSYTVIAWASKTLADEPLTALKHALGITTPWVVHLPFVFQVALVIFLVEFGQYWMHRLMHNQAFFWSTHAPHHHLTQLNAMKGAVGNPIELFLISLSVLALLDLPQPAMFCALNVLAVVSTFAHANTRFDPPRWYAFVFTTIQHHSLHHSVSYEATRSNYGNSLILLDRIFGTYSDGEAEIVGQDDRRRLSIGEQFLFPARPLIARLTARRGQPAPESAEVAA
ncbi:sterol desaturase family protein [Sphingomonas aerophila]|uniref:Sterol desaturase/sphingolipid hydroxylase (Fatty acid hydroxylase superfamily) n=1 Tax=Sphingomonas aerophila TaxID=1344948 RepID=A0A7W9EVR5_9SPHN|nr:sterol desaturase family protein [Sphingomonas aerophila]MBB5716511.1 sterol desaturase/sphingolipid hydroxylase (fatty acid hydroxylase superfamily) [Sphingomonas aerophila]